MTINQDKGYNDVLKHIASHELKYITDGLLSGRRSIIDKWIRYASIGRTLGPKSISILSNDIDCIVSNIYGFDFE
jgi:hypothetical protein